MDNSPFLCLDRILPTEAYVNSQAARIALLKAKKWPSGGQLTISLRSPSPAQKAKVQRTYEELMQYVNLDFRFGSNGEIRIEFRPGQAWSMIGTDSTSIATSQPSMNLGFGLSDDDGNAGTYLHEFGHALGAIHEHQNPLGGIKWNRQQVIRDLSKPPNSWDLATIEHNMFDQYSRDQINGTQFDRGSIMLYAIPASWTTDGFTSQPNTRLSDLDKSWLRSQYPGRGGDPGGGGGGNTDLLKLPVQDRRFIRDSILTPGSRDLWVFEAPVPGRYKVEASGPSSVALKVFGPNDQTTLRAQTDNALTPHNALLVATLDQAGKYYAQVSHADPVGVGEYGLRCELLDPTDAMGSDRGEIIIKALLPLGAGTFGLTRV